MRPKKTKSGGQDDLFRSRLDQIIDMKHELVTLARKIDWEWIDQEVAGQFSEAGRPGTETRFMVGLLILKHMFGLSDEGVCERWVYDPYFRAPRAHVSGMLRRKEEERPEACPLL